MRSSTMLRKTRSVVAVLAAMFAAQQSMQVATAAPVTYVTPTSSTAGGQPVSASATFTTSVNDLLITIVNNQANPTSDIQTVNGISFTLSTGQTVSSSFTEKGIERTVTGKGAGGYTDVGTPTTLVQSANKWNLNNTTGLGIEITSIGNTGGHGTLIGNPNGSNAYASANPSITNSNHNPFVAGTVTFDLTISGLTSSSTITAMRFEFGTASGTNVTGVPDTNTNAVPEPTTLTLAGMALLGAFGYGYRRSKKS